MLGCAPSPFVPQSVRLPRMNLLKPLPLLVLLATSLVLGRSAALAQPAPPLPAEAPPLPALELSSPESLPHATQVSAGRTTHRKFGIFRSFNMSARMPKSSDT